MAAFFYAVLATAFLIQMNEALRTSMKTTEQLIWKARHARNAAAFSSMQQTMTTQKALEVIPKVRGSSPDFLSLIQENLDTTHHFKTHRQTPAGASGNSQSAYTGGTNVALARINDMMLETIEKHDFEDIRCHDYNRSQMIILTEIEEDRKILETLGETAAADKADAFAQKNKYQSMVDKQRIEIKTWQEQCSQESKELQAQYDVAAGDSNVMFKVLEMVDCEGSTAFMQVSKDNQAVMMNCYNARSGRTYHKVSITGGKLKAALASLKHPKVVQLLSENLEQDPGEFKYGYGIVPMKATTEVDPDMADEKCSLANSTKCPELRERFLNIQGGIEDTIMQIEHFIANHKIRCTHTEQNMRHELSLYISSVDRYTVLEKKAVETMGEYDLQVQEKSVQFAQTSKELSDELAQCDQIIKELTEEHCALGKIRGELMKMESMPNTVTDCEVTEWTPQECSVTCGGGKRALTRMITVHTDGGHHCPPLTMEQTCNSERCPTDCEVEDWSGWGPCSAFCNGGVEERLRKITQHNTPGGDACPQTSETQECNLNACDADCELYDWSPWSSTCNKICGGGRLTRQKHLKAVEIGSGTCPAYHDHMRFEAKPCNTQECLFDRNRNMVCDAKIDLIIIMDGSGSLGATGFDRIKKAAAKLSKAMGANAQVASLVFSGPPWDRTEHPSWNKNWWMCSGYDWAQKEYGGWKGADANDACGMHWATSMSADMGTVASAIEAAEYPGHYTFMHTALKLAGEELRFGRQDAQSIILTITDSVPTWEERTIRAAEEVMKKARLMWVPVGISKNAVSAFTKLASYPVSDNVIDFHSIASLDDVFTVDKIITTFCPVVHYGVQTTTTAAAPDARRRRRTR